MNKRDVRLAAFRFLAEFDSKIKTKFDNISAKTGRYSVPVELFQERCPRSNRVLISWKTVLRNHLSYEQLKSFTGGVVVEFVNEDFFAPENQNNPLFIQLKEKIGSDDMVSSIITIRSESGSPSSAIPREYYYKLTNNTKIKYKDDYVTITENNFNDFAIKQIASGGTGNEKWTGFLYISVKGGQQNSIQSHKNLDYTIFNPACEYANDDVREDINLVMAYFAFMSIDIDSLNTEKKNKYIEIINNIRTVLAKAEYEDNNKTDLLNNNSNKINLLDYCNNHLCLKICPGKLYDPIQAKEIIIWDFAIDNKDDNRCVDFTHDEAVYKEIYHWDKVKNCILSPARPTNVFWSKHWSNMMQQNCYLKEFIKYQEEIVERRNHLLRQNVT